MNNKVLLPLLLFTIISCSESFNIDLSFGDSESESINPGVDNAFASTYVPMNSEPILFRSANIYDGLGGEFRNYDLLLSEGKILEIGESIKAPGVIVIDATDKWITPGIIDIHSHMGVYSAPGVSTSSDGNEATSPVTAEVWAEHSLWTQDPQFALALKGGVTTFHVLPGSANLFGGRGATFKNVSQNTVQAMKFPGAPHSLKMACGENPKRVYGNRRQAPSTRMGNMAGYRSAWIDAVEAYKIADLLADEGICAALWADWWGFKHEAYDMVQANVAIIDQARNGTGCAIVHSDDAVGIQHLNQEAAKAMAAGNRAGFEISKAHAMRWITSNPAKAAGILDQTGSIEVGKDADVVVWNGNPFSVYSRAEKVLIDGALAFDMDDPRIQPITDFDLGIIKPQDNRVQ